MKQNTCQNCNKLFDCTSVINGKKFYAYNRTFCFDCSPYGEHNTSKVIYNRKPSIIDAIPLEEFKILINSSFSRTQVFQKLKLHRTGASFKILNSRLLRDNIDISHFKKSHEFERNQKVIPNDVIFTEDSNYAKGALKRRIIKQHLLKYICASCSNTGMFNSKPLVLQLDHINGINNDNRLCNLQFLCPNCHSQTYTFCRKNKKR